MKTKQYEQGWTAYFDNDDFNENPYTKPEWVLEWDLGYREAKSCNEGTSTHGLWRDNPHYKDRISFPV